MAWKSGPSYLEQDLRSRVLAAVDGGSPAKAVAQLFQVSVSYIDEALGRRSATGETAGPRAQRNQQTLKLAGIPTLSRPSGAPAGRHPGGARAWLLATHEVKARLGLMHKTLARLGLTLKKSRGRAPLRREASICAGEQAAGLAGVRREMKGRNRCCHK